MAETTTANFGWTKPDPGASANTWGQTLNATTDKIDAVAFANQNAGVPIGTVVMFAGATAPAGWMICDGRALVIASYTALSAVLGTAFNVAGVAAGSFNLPDLRQKFPIGAGTNVLGSSGGNFSVTLGPTNLPAHAHTIQDPQHYHTITDVAHGHGFNQWSHNHGDAGHGHGVSASASQDDHSHGYQHVGSGGAGVQSGAAGASIQNYNTGGSSANGVYVSVGIGTGYANIDSRTSSGSVVNSGSNIHNTDYGLTRITTTDNYGSGAAFNVVPPFQALNYIIRAT